jgi:hypothetical protein
MILVKHKPELIPSDSFSSHSNTNSGIYFSNQVKLNDKMILLVFDSNIYYLKIVHDAYAMHALLNILLNCGGTIDVGAELNHFKQFTYDFSPMVNL